MDSSETVHRGIRSGWVCFGRLHLVPAVPPGHCEVASCLCHRVPLPGCLDLTQAQNNWTSPSWTERKGRGMGQNWYFSSLFQVFCHKNKEINIENKWVLPATIFNQCCWFFFKRLWNGLWKKFAKVWKTGKCLDYRQWNLMGDAVAQKSRMLTGS